MPRFERKDRFWDIAVDDSTVSICQGVVGTDGEFKKKYLPNSKAAQTFYEDLVGQVMAEGYRDVKGTMAPPDVESPEPAKAPAVAARNPDYEAMIADDLDSMDAYLAYADWLQEQGDPRGELIVVQHALLSAPRDAELFGTQARLLREHKERFWSAVAPYVDELVEQTEWYLGFVKHAKLKTTGKRCPTVGDSGTVPYEPLLRDFLGLESCQFLQSLTLGIAAMAGNDYSGAIRVLAERARPMIKNLYIGDFDYEETELNWSNIGLVEPLCQALPNLEELTLRSHDLDAGRLSFPKLRSFTVIGGGLNAKALGEIANADWPQLRSLSVQLGRAMTSEQALKALEPIFAAKGLSSVRHLGLGNFRWSDDLCGRLARSAIAPQLESLDMSVGTMGDAGAQALAAQADRFPNLNAIDASWNFLSGTGVEALETLATEVDSSEQHVEEAVEDRYISGYE